ncbi:unnamed protein product [Trifolium pratense]|uniref:Uncharacterized protein n=1 Tax=Trifolium pratense TaxID=57577 RepID=A0ACB0IZM4_TRIPR|nr:unnamed protein product [Trifolium pratense]
MEHLKDSCNSRKVSPYFRNVEESNPKKVSPNFQKTSRDNSLLPKVSTVEESSADHANCVKNIDELLSQLSIFGKFVDKNDSSEGPKVEEDSKYSQKRRLIVEKPKRKSKNGAVGGFDVV